MVEHRGEPDAARRGLLEVRAATELYALPMMALLLAAACAWPCERPSHAWELAGVYTLAAGLDEASGVYARQRRGPQFQERGGMRDLTGRMALKVVLAPAYVLSANRMLRSHHRSLRIAGRVLEVALPAAYLYGAARNLHAAR